MHPQFVQRPDGLKTKGPRSLRSGSHITTLSLAAVFLGDKAGTPRLPLQNEGLGRLGGTAKYKTYDDTTH